MFIRTLTLVSLAACLFVSCDTDNTDQYEGIWQGSFAGDREGTWKIGIESDGAARGSMTPKGEEQGFSISGSVNEDGELVMTAVVFGRDAVYNAVLTETYLNGNWSAQDNAFEGEWSGAKNEQDERFPYGLILYP
ncbi:MAG: hypothetical protein AAGC47_07830 [Bacteroidota bacterium]